MNAPAAAPAAAPTPAAAPAAAAPSASPAEPLAPAAAVAAEDVANVPLVEEVPAAAAAADDVPYVPLVEEAEVPHLMAVAQTQWWETPAMAGAPRQLRAHFGTDMQQGCWWMLIGCVLYALVMVLIVARDTSRLDKWLELLAALIFCVGCLYLVEGSYPSSMMATFERLAAPPKLDRTFVERYIASSAMMLSTQLFNVGMLPYLVEGALNMANPPADDPPDAALWLFLSVFLCLPLLLLFSYQTTDEAMRANDGIGTKHTWEHCTAPLVRCLGGSSPFWQRHLGTDNLFVLWLFFVLMTLGTVPLVPMWLMDPSDAQQLCGLSMSCGASLLVSAPFAIGAGLMVRATYPENFGKASLLGEMLNGAGRALLDCATSLQPDPSVELTA